MKKFAEKQISVPRFSEANGFYTTRQRSELMGRIKSRNTKPEILLKKSLWNLGYQYRKTLKKLPGDPDIVYAKKKLAIFVDGEFWHGYNWSEKKLKIKTNRDFWIPKIERNMQRDEKNNQLLEDIGWNVIRFWEKQIEKDLDGCINIIVGYLTAEDS